MSGLQQSAVPAAGPTRHARRSLQSDRAAPSGRSELWFIVSAALLAVWALFQNLYKIGTAPVIADEPTYIIAARRYIQGQVAAPRPVKASNYLGATPDNFEHPPLVKYLFGVAQWLDGSPGGLNAPRVVSGLATVLAAAVVAVWIGRVAGRWTGLLAGAMLTVIPEASSGTLGRFDRFAMLDPTASAFMVLSVVVAWVWAHRGGRSGWVWAVLTGVSVGLASGAKENGFLGAVGPVLLAVVFALMTKDRKTILVRSAQAVLALVVSLCTFVGLYAPFPHPIARIRYLIDFQSTQSANGHLTGFAGQVSAKPPWWANFWFAGHNYGPVLTGFIILSVLCAIVLRRDRLVAWCLSAIAAPFVFHCFLANVTLGYYWVMWTPMFLVLSALGAAEVIKLARRLARPATAVAAPIAVLTGLAVLAIPATQSVAESVTVADLKPTGVELVPQLMKQNDLHGDVVTAGLPLWYWTYYMPKTTVYQTATRPIPDTAVIVIGQPQCRQLVDQSVRALVAVNLRTGAVREIHTDSEITAYAVEGRLTLPDAAQIAAEPAGKLTDNC